MFERLLLRAAWTGLLLTLVVFAPLFTLAWAAWLTRIGPLFGL